MSTEHPANYLTTHSATESELKQSLDEYLATMKSTLGGASPTELTISSGAVTPVSGAHSVDGESDSADTLENVSTANHLEGQLLLLWPADASRDITIKHQAGGAGQIHLRSNGDLLLDDIDNHILLQRQGDDWYETGYLGDFMAENVVAMKRLEATDAGVKLSQSGDQIDLNKGSVNIHAEAGGTDHTASGIIATLTTDDALVFGDICCLDTTSGNYKKATAATVAIAPSVVMALGSSAATESGSFLLNGFARDDSWSWTVGGEVYASDTAGVLTQTAGGAMLGVATDTNLVRFAPDMAAVALQVAAGEMEFDPAAGGVDHTASGITMEMTAGASLAFGDICFLNSDGELEKANADSASTMPATFMALDTMAIDDTKEVLVQGVARDASWSWTTGGTVYASTTGGGLTQTAPTGYGEYAQKVGLATGSDRILFDPDKTVNGDGAVVNYWESDANTFVVDMDGWGAGTDPIGVGAGLAEVDRTLTDATNNIPAATGDPASKTFTEASSHKLTLTSNHASILGTGTTWTVAIQLQIYSNPSAGAHHPLFIMRNNTTSPYHKIQIKHIVDIGWEGLTFHCIGNGGTSFNYETSSGQMPTDNTPFYVFMQCHGTNTLAGWCYDRPSKWSDMEYYQKTGVKIDYSGASFVDEKNFGYGYYGHDYYADMRLHKYLISKSSLLTVDV